LNQCQILRAREKSAGRVFDGEKLAVKCAVNPETPPQGLTLGWRAILALYDLY
jgi:hypothetical protein